METTKLLTVDDVAKMLQVPSSWVYKHTKKRLPNRLPHVKIGKYIRFRESEISDFIERNIRV